MQKYDNGLHKVIPRHLPFLSLWINENESKNLNYYVDYLFYM